MMLLSELLENMNYEQVVGASDVEIGGLCTDSRRIKKGDLFFVTKAGMSIRMSLRRI